jgi:ribokinase
MRHRIPVARFPEQIMKTAGKLVVLGSINADHILNLDAFPTPGETVTGHHYQVAFGGKGANQAVAAGRSGADIAFIACTGDDDIGERVRVSWKAIISTSRRSAPLPENQPAWR